MRRLRRERSEDEDISAGNMTETKSSGPGRRVTKRDSELAGLRIGAWNGKSIPDPVIPVSPVEISCFFISVRDWDG